MLKNIKTGRICIIDTIWYTIEQNYTKKNQFIIKDIIRWKIFCIFKTKIKYQRK